MARGPAPAALGQTVLFEIVEDHIACVRLNRPERRNAIDGDVAECIEYLVAQIDDDPAIRVAILGSASPGMFCAGADLKEMAEGRGDRVMTAQGGFAGFCDARRDTPWIAAVDGSAMGGGFELCLACDIVVAADAAQFGLPEVKRGLFAAAGGVHRLGRAIPRNLALEMVTTGDPITAGRAHALGLVNRCCESGGVWDEALAVARSISANAPMSVRESLAIARLANELTDGELRALSAVATEKVFGSLDAQEGPRAFIERRPPRWQGR